MRVPRNVDDNPVAVEGFHPDGIEFVIEPVGVSGGVGGGVEEDFKVHLIFPKRFVVCYALIIIYIGRKVNNSLV